MRAARRPPRLALALRSPGPHLLRAQHLLHFASPLPVVSRLPSTKHARATVDQKTAHITARRKCDIERGNTGVPFWTPPSPRLPERFSCLKVSVSFPSSLLPAPAAVTLFYQSAVALQHCRRLQQQVQQLCVPLRVSVMR